MSEGDARAEFIARLTAGATHELRNVLAIVKESAGLIEDLFAVAGPAGSPDPVRVGRALGRIEEQVRRGAEILTSLNAVAHGLDRPSDTVDLDAAARHVVCLCRRFAHQGKRRVDVVDSRGSPRVTGNALDIYRALATGLDSSLDRTPEGGEVHVWVEEVEGGGRVHFGSASSDGTPEPGEDAFAALARCLADLPAVPERSEAEGRWTLVFS